MFANQYSDSEDKVPVGCGGEETESEWQKGPIAGAPAYIRRGFVRKVYGILSVQLLLTVCIAAPFNIYLSPEWAAQNMGFYYLALFATLGIVLGMACCCQEAARQYPTNYMFLFGITLAESVVIGYVVTLYTGPSVMLAVMATALLFSALTAYACFTTTDFTGMGPYLTAGLMAIMSFSFVIMICSFFMPIPPAVHLMYAGLAVVLFSFYVVYDTQLIIGGQHQNQFDIDDYCFAALNLYLDIINIFLYILSLLGERR